MLVSHVDGLTVTGNRFNDCYIGLCLNSNNTNDTSKPFQQATVIKEIIHGNDDAGTSSYVLVLSGKAPMATDTKTITLWDVAYKRVGLATDKATGNAEDTLSKIGFYANGGTFGADSNNPDRQITDVTYVAFDGTEITLPTAPTRDGYTFTGWATAPPEGQTPVKLGNDATTYKADHSLQFLAQWEKVTTFTVTYTDGVDGEEIFPDQSYTVESGKTTPAFNGTPTRKDYTFTGWKPAVAATVTGNATYEATWKSNSATTTSSGNTSSGNTSSAGKTSSTGKTTSPKTGDASNVLPWFALLFISGGAAIGTTVISRKKKYNK